MGTMSPLPAPFAALTPLLPEEQVGAVTAVQPISMGLSGAGVYAVSTTAGELVLRVQSQQQGPSDWTQQLRILRRAADAGVAPPLIHVDEGARAVVSRRVAGVLLPVALRDPAQRSAALASVVAQLRALHALDATDVEVRDPLVHARRQLARQRVRPGFPPWAGGLESALDAIEETLSGDPRRVVSHNDLNPGNVLWDGTRAWLVDWEVSGLAHPFYDLAALAMFIGLDATAAHRLLAQLDDNAVGGAAEVTFAALRRLVALLAGVTFLSMVPDLALLPPSALTLAECHAGMRAGTLDLQDPAGRAAFALGLLRTGLEGAGDGPPR
jgi:aminoglycoside phosphotransferase (APT) family kinase protein